MPIPILAHLPPVAAQCMVDAANYYRVPLVALVGIERAERGTPGKIHWNYNKQGKRTSYDIGRMQINSSGLPELRQYGITEQGLLENDCKNIYVGAWVLEKKMKAHPDLWTAIGAYNSATPSLNLKYQRSVWRQLQGLWGNKNQE